MKERTLLPVGTRPRLSAFIVNYESGAFALNCARSLRRQWGDAGYDMSELEITVVDNASPTEQIQWLSVLEDEGVRVIESTKNVGYAGAVRLAYESSSGDDDDYIAILNPDVVFLPGSVRTMIEHLEGHPECGVIAPRAYLDEECTFLLPAIPLPTVRGELASSVARVSPRLGRAVARRRTATNLRAWSAELPIGLGMLSGACLFLPRAVANDMDGLFDERYPLYFEDADLCRRLAAKGLELVHHPRARILHHWSRSAGSGESFDGEPRRRYDVSRQAYFGQHANPFGRVALKLAERVVEKLPGTRVDRPLHPLTHLIPGDGVRVQLYGEGPFLLELALTPTWAVSAGCVADAGEWTFPRPAWEWLFPGRYYLRAIEVPTRKLLGAWTFMKNTPARTEPVELDGDGAAEGKGPWDEELYDRLQIAAGEGGWRRR